MDEVIMTGAEEEVRWQKTLILSLEKQHIELNEYMNEWMNEWMKVYAGDTLFHFRNEQKLRC